MTNVDGRDPRVEGRCIWLDRNRVRDCVCLVDKGGMSDGVFTLQVYPRVQGGVVVVPNLLLPVFGWGVDTYGIGLTAIVMI